MDCSNAEGASGADNALGAQHSKGAAAIIQWKATPTAAKLNVLSGTSLRTCGSNFGENVFCVVKQPRRNDTGEHLHAAADRLYEKLVACLPRDRAR